MLEALYKWTWYSDTSKTGLRTNWKVKDPRNIVIRFEPIVDEDNYPVTFKFLDKSNRRPDYYIELTHDIDGFLWLPKKTHLQSGMCFRMRISQNSHAKRKFCEISHSHRIAEPFLDSHNFRKMRTKFLHAKISQNANFRKMRTFRMRIFTKCEFSQNANFSHANFLMKKWLILQLSNITSSLELIFLDQKSCQQYRSGFRIVFYRKSLLQSGRL